MRPMTKPSLNNLIKPVLFMMAMLSIDSAYAADCYPIGSPHEFNFDYSFDSSQNYIGFSTPWREINIGGKYNMGGPCAGNVYNTYFTFKEALGLTPAGSDGGAQWFNVSNNDYLQIAMQVYIVGGRETFVNIPQNSVSNECNGSCLPPYGTGGRVNIKLRIKKKFVGQSFLVNRDIGLIYAASGVNDNPSQPIAIIRLNTTFTVPQSCSFDVGDVIEFDFGQISSGAFSVGAGNRARGVNTITKNIGIDCKNIDAQQMLSARLEVANPKDNIILSNNSDVGFQIADNSDRVLIPNNINSYIPFRLDDNARSSFILKSWPVSVTGEIPQAGPVAAQGHIRVDFQ
ncbi:MULTISPECIES: fimbrial protein [Acinetobacter]|uniref:fimbrial protein n=1 Tax=Acinetobacter TaxID=469 RepID=UPI00141B3252|nr:MULTISPECIES: fimbrial protein [Acinetobacter]MCS4299144.1 minor fimbrial subunit [Acinetobacter guillouiae]MCW2250209.1 minor fimbrial subunit [Acinetobacter sp. BIGb0204]NII39312.1 minor fimbrial subunit [Acinetobacter sp. BIGb0196]